MPQENTMLDDISAVVGLTATVTLSAWFGGLGNLWVPLDAVDGQLLVRLIGMPAARRMTQEWGGTFLSIPPLTAYQAETQRHLIGRMSDKGFAISEIARHVGLSPRRVQQVCRELEQVGLIGIRIGKPRSEVRLTAHIYEQSAAGLDIQHALGSTAPVGSLDCSPANRFSDDDTPNDTYSG